MKGIGLCFVLVFVFRAGVDVRCLCYYTCITISYLILYSSLLLFSSSFPNTILFLSSPSQCSVLFPSSLPPLPSSHPQSDLYSSLLFLLSHPPILNLPLPSFPPLHSPFPPDPFLIQLLTPHVLSEWMVEVCRF